MSGPMVAPEIYRMGIGAAVAVTSGLAVLSHWIFSKLSRPPEMPEGATHVVVHQHHSGALYVCVMLVVIGMIPVIHYLALVSALWPFHH